MKRLIQILVIILIILGTFFTFQYVNGTNKKLSFANYTESKSYIEKGWIPKSIPSTAINIKINYDLDSSISNGQFELPNKEEMEIFKDSLNKESNITMNINFINKEYKNIFTKTANESNLYSKGDFIFLYDGNNKFYFFSK